MKINKIVVELEPTEETFVEEAIKNVINDPDTDEYRMETLEKTLEKLQEASRNTVFVF